MKIPAGQEKGEMMRSVSVSACKIILAVILWALVLLPCGCKSYEQLGETTAEGRRRHERIARINCQEMMTDIDKVMLFDKSSKLTDKRIP